MHRQTLREKRRFRAAAGLALAVACLGTGASEGAAQTVRPPRIVEVGTVPEVPAFGEAFRLELTLRVPPGTSVDMPDTLIAATDVRGVGRGGWRPAPAPGDSLDVVASYPAIGFVAGPVVLPDLEVRLRAIEGPGMLHPPGDRTAAASPAEARVLSLGAVEIAPYAPMEATDSGTSFLPRPAADVLGGDWGVGFRLALTLTLVVAVAVAGSAARRVWVHRGATVASRTRGRTAREEAVRELERIRASGWHREGRIDDFYDATTAALRTFASRVDPAWVPALTSGELIARIEERWGDRAEPLRPVIDAAERVKFGHLRPTADEAEADWRVVRDWIRDLPGL
jgi:hypothetical protein